MKLFRIYTSEVEETADSHTADIFFWRKPYYFRKTRNDYFRRMKP